MATKHPGLRIKEEILPAEMSVTKAAELLNVGRPALSNLFNGKAKLSAQMAQRLSNTFDVPLERLLQWQADYEEDCIHQTNAPITHIYAPPFLDIKANEIEKWVDIDEISARSRLAVFLRTLAHSTCKSISKINFPGNDDSQRPGWDGWIESNDATPWIPEALSSWEFGVNKDITTKANNDFDKSVKAHAQDSTNITFVFVTPRRWSGKDKWVKKKKALNKWKDVRAYDSSDLEQWLAQSLPAQSWLANEAKLPTQNVSSLDSIWREWACVCNPNLIPSFFAKLIESHKDKIKAYLSQPPQKPFYIAADSKIEAMAFLFALLSNDNEFLPYRDNCLVFKDKNILPRLAEGSKNFIAVTSNEEVESELAQYAHQIHSFVVCSKNASTQHIDIKLEILDSTTFIRALEEMGIPYDDATVLAKKSGYSLTVLRRQLSTTNAIKKPKWVEDSNKALIPFLLAGIWDSDNKNDRIALERLSGDIPYEDLEKELQTNLTLDDSPVWVVGSYRGVLSKIDLLFVVAPYITKADLEHYFEVAKLILEEDDPALDLPEDQQWQANIYDKKRIYSKELRDSVGEMLILLAVHGNELFLDRLGTDCESAVNSFVRELFSPLTLRKLQANASDLSTYAEAAPQAFLDIINNDLKSNKITLELMQPVKNIPFSSPKYTDLLWALEKLSWDKSTVTQVVSILAQLSQKEINDNYGNKPFASLSAIFRSWFPATSVSTQDRILLLQKLIKDFPDIGWRICINELPNGFPRMAMPSSKCIWRRDSNVQNPITNKDVYDFCKAIIDIVLNWSNYTMQNLLDLVSNIHSLSIDQQDRIWQLIKDWALNQATESEKIQMREKLSTTVLSRRAKRHSNNITFTELGEQAYIALEPKELIDKYYWLFKSQWVDKSADELEEIPEMDFSEREEFIRQKRVEALKEIFQENNYQDILDLCLKGDCASTIGFLLRRSVFSSNQNTMDLIKLALKHLNQANHINYKSLIRGMLFESNDNTSLFNELDSCLSDSDKVQLYLQSPFRSSIWNLVNSLDENYRKEYWGNIIPSYYEDIKEVADGTRYLLSANRPQSAFTFILPILKKIEPEIAFEVLSAMLLPTAKNENNPPDSYWLGEAFSRISDSMKLSLEQKAGLEYSYIVALAPYGRKNENGSIRNLEMYIEEHPEFFVQLISKLCKRDDGVDDKEKDDFKTEEQKGFLFKQIYYTLKALSRIPGENDSGEIDSNKLREWVNQVIILSEREGRKNRAEYFIGELLSYCKTGKDNIWPCEEVRDLVENICSENMLRGMYIGKHNSRGVTSRLPGDGGNQEREIAAMYKDWSEKLAITHPVISRELHNKLAKSYQDEAKRWDDEDRLEMHLK